MFFLFRPKCGKSGLEVQRSQPCEEGPRVNWWNTPFSQRLLSLFQHSTGLGLGPLVMNQGHSFSYSDSLIFIKIQQYRRSMVQPGTSGNRCCKFVVWSDQHFEYTGNHGTQHYCCWSKKNPVWMLKLPSLHPIGWNAIHHLQKYWKEVASMTCQVKSNCQCWRMSKFEFGNVGVYHCLDRLNLLENKESWKGSKVTPSNVWEGIDRGWCSSSWRARSY